MENKKKTKSSSEKGNVIVNTASSLELIQTVMATSPFGKINDLSGASVGLFQASQVVDAYKNSTTLFQNASNGILQANQGVFQVNELLGGKLSAMSEVSSVVCNNTSLVTALDRSISGLYVTEGLSMFTNSALSAGVFVSNNSALLSDALSTCASVIGPSMLAGVGEIVLKQHEGSLVNLSSLVVQGAQVRDSMVSVNLSDFRVKEDNSGVLSFTTSTTTVQTTEVGIAHMELTQKIQLQLGNVENKIDKVQQFLIADSEHKDEMLEELISYIKTGGAFIVPINKIIFQKATCELVLDECRISFKQDTNQFYLCSILCSDIKKLTAGWDVMDVAEKMGEDIENITDKEEIRTLQEKIYSTVRHLNDKIKGEVGLDTFFIYSRKVIMLNPKFSKKRK